MASNELIFRYALKRFPSDFRVSEVLLPAVVEPSTDSFHYLRLTKSGYTTFEAIDLVASHLGLASSQVGYAGLKDEDAVTDQYLSIAGFVAQREIDRFNHLYLAGGYQSEAPFMQLQHHCHSDRGLEAGELDGNSFRIVVRDLHEDRANRLADVKSRYNFFFINYYDTQRFGVPHGPKQTHLIGQAISVKDYATAFRLLKSSCSPEAAKCAEFTGTPEDFFGHLDQRRVAFYLSASSSATWNEQVRQGLRDTSTGGLVELSRGRNSLLVSQINGSSTWLPRPRQRI